MFQALADPTRRIMVERLSRGPASVSELARPLPISLPAVVQHLQVLEQSGLVERTESASDRRCKLIYMTPAGEKVYRQTMEIAGKIATKMMRHVSDEELAKRKAAWKPRGNDAAASGYLWKYSQQVGPAVNGAVTHPGGAAEKECYADS